MASKAPAASAALFLAVNLLFFAIASACGTCPSPNPNPKPKPTPSPTPKPPTPSSGGKCPIDTLKLTACANVLNGLITLGVSKFPRQPCECCTLLGGLVDAEAAVCLCTAIKANVLGINLDLPVDLSLLLNYCGKKAPKEFQCPY